MVVTGAPDATKCKLPPAFHKMRTHTRTRCPERVDPSFLRTPRGIVEIFHPAACSSQAAPGTCSLKAHSTQRYSSGAFQQGRVYKAVRETSQSAPLKPSQQKPYLPYSPGGRQCVACNTRRGAGLASNSSSRSNSISRRPSLSRQIAARSAADIINRICNHLPSAAETVSAKPPIACVKTTSSVRPCPCLAACQQKRHTAALCGCLCTCFDCGEPVAVHTGGSYSAPQLLEGCHHAQHGRCRRSHVQLRNEEKQKAGCDNRFCRVGDDYATFSPEASPNQISAERASLCGASVGSCDKSESFCEDGKTTAELVEERIHFCTASTAARLTLHELQQHIVRQLTEYDGVVVTNDEQGFQARIVRVQWALRNVRTEAARTRRVLEGCRSQLLAREEKLKAPRKSPRAAIKHSSTRCTPRSHILKCGADGKGIAPFTNAAAALKENATASQVGECHARQQGHPRKEQEEMGLIFRQRFEQEMRAFRRRLTSVAGNLNDKLSMLVERETQLKLTAEELLKERENASRLRRIYFKATIKNKQLAARNTSLERALLDVELKLCRPHNVWKALGCPAAAALRNELQGENRLYDGSTTASDSSSAQKSTPSRASIPLPQRRACIRACMANWPHTLEGAILNREERHTDRHAPCSLSGGNSAFVSTNHTSRRSPKGCAIGDRLCRSLPCFLHPSDASHTSLEGEQETDSSQHTQQNSSKTTRDTAHTTRKGTHPHKREHTDPHKREDKREEGHQRPHWSLPEKRRQSAAEQERDTESLPYSHDEFAETETIDRRQSRDGGVKKSECPLSGLTLKPGTEREAETSICLTHRLCRALQQRRRSAELSCPRSRASFYEKRFRPGSPSSAPSPRTDGPAEVSNVKKTISVHSRSPPILCRRLLSSHHPTAANPSPPLPLRGLVKTSSQAAFSPRTPRGEKTTPGTKCACSPGCVAPTAANKSELPCLKELAASADHAKCGFSADVFPCRRPCSRLFQCTSQKVHKKASLLAVPPEEQPWMDQSFCGDKCDGLRACKFSSGRRFCPTSTTSLPKTSSNCRSPSNFQTSVPIGWDSVIHVSCSNYLTGAQGSAETLGDHLGTQPLMREDHAAAGVCYTSVAGNLRAHTSVPGAEGQYPFTEAVRKSETSVRAEDAAGCMGTTLTASKSFSSVAPATVFACCPTVGPREQSRTTWQAAAADSGPPTLCCSSSASLITAKRHQRGTSPAPPALSTAGESCQLPQQALGSCPSPTAILHAESSSNTNCTQEIINSSSSTSSSSSGQLEPYRVETAFQRIRASNGSQCGCSSSPHRRTPAASTESCASSNSSNTDCDHLNRTTDRNSGSCCCCCLSSSVADARQQEIAGCTTRCSEESNALSPFIRGKEARTTLYTKENEPQIVYEMKQGRHVRNCVSSDAISFPEAADSAIRERRCGSAELPTRVEEGGRSLHDAYTNINNCTKVDPCTDAACSFSSSSSSSASVVHSSSSSPFAALPSSSSSESAFQCSSIPTFSCSAGVSSSCESSFMRFAEERMVPSCPAPSDTCGKKCCHALDGCISWHLPHPTRIRAVP